MEIINKSTNKKLISSVCNINNYPVYNFGFDEGIADGSSEGGKVLNPSTFRQNIFCNFFNIQWLYGF